MSPILIERSDLFKLVTLFVMLTSGIFLGGVIYGYTKADYHHHHATASYELVLPVARDTTLREPLTPTSVEPGVDRDVDLAEGDHELTANPHADRGQAAGRTAAPAAGEKRSGTDTVAAETLQATEHVAAIGGPHEPIEDDPMVLMKDTADVTSARYTIQVGLFSSAGNAERKVEELVAKQLNAYATDYTDKKQRQLFNVRFGYFDSKRNARLALDAFRSVFSDDGYLVRLNH